MKNYEIYEATIGNETFVASIRSIDEQGNTLSIPINPANSDYQEYLASLEATEPETE
jgi:hypothetical protein